MNLAISDQRKGRLAFFDMHTMSLERLVDVGPGPYPCDQVGLDLLYVSTRRARSLTPVVPSTGEVLAPIGLTHQPRSTTLDPGSGLAFVAGRDRVVVSVVEVDTGKVIDEVGSGEADPRRDYGGSLACGHPGVGPDGEILLLDRIARRIEMYELGTAAPVASMNLPTSPHHVHAHDGRFYAMCEGNPASRIPPSVVVFEVRRRRFRVLVHTFLPVLPRDFARTGGHHLTLDPPLQALHVGTAAGWVITLSMDDGTVLSRTQAGAGCGHVTLCPEIGLGVTTNHLDRFMTVFELATGRRHGDVRISGPSKGGAKTQGHTSVWDGGAERLYTTAAQDGRLVELDPVALEVTDALVVPDADLIQGTVVRSMPVSGA